MSALPTMKSGGGVAAIVPQSFDEVFRLASAAVAAKMTPDSIDTAEKATIAIMQGLEVGMTPMVALQSIAVINGTPSIWGDGALGLIRGSGLCESVKEWKEGEGEGLVAYCAVKRKGEPEPIQRSFSFAEAGKAGLLTKKGPWLQYPARMMQMRARSWALRDGFADVLKGLAIAEEAQDFDRRVKAEPQKSTLQERLTARNAAQIENQQEGYNAAAATIEGEILAATDETQAEYTAYAHEQQAERREAGDQASEKAQEATQQDGQCNPETIKGGRQGAQGTSDNPLSQGATAIWSQLDPEARKSLDEDSKAILKLLMEDLAKVSNPKAAKNALTGHQKSIRAIGEASFSELCQAAVGTRCAQLDGGM